MLSIDNKSFRDKMKKYGKQMNVLINFDDTTIDRTYVKKIEPSVNGELYTSVMRQLTIEVEKSEVIDSEKIYTVKKVHESTVETVDNLRVKFLATDLNTSYTVDEVNNMLTGVITETKVRHFVDRDAIQDIINASLVNVKVGVRLSEDEEYEYLDYGEFVVYDKEDKVDTHSIKIYLYDHLIDTHIKYDDEPLQLDFENGEITVLKLLQAICSKFGFTLKTTNFANANKPITEDKYSGLDYIYRDILDEIAATAGGFIKIFNKDLYVAYPEDTGEIIDENDLEKLTIGEKNGAYNSLVLGRSPQEDNIYYPSNMKDEDRISIRIDNNQIMDKNREDFIEEIYNKINGLEYYSFEFTSFGFGYFEFGDIVTLKDLDGNEYKTIMLNIAETIDSGIKGKNYAEKTDYAETKYEYATGIEKRLINTEIICDKQQNQIKLIIEQQGETETKINSFTMDLESTKSEIKNFEDSTNKKMSSFEQTAESLSGEVQNVKTNIENNYYTKTQTDSKIEAKAGEITISVGKSIETAKQEAISTSDSNTDDKLKNYSSTTQMNAAINLKFDEITLNVSKTYSTKEETTQVKQDAINSANSFTDDKLKSYSTTEEMNAEIELQIEAINLEVSKKYTTKTEFTSGMSTTKNEAINSANASTDAKLKSYSTTTEMNAAIKLQVDSITTEVNKKVNNSEFGTKLQQSATDIQIAWNKISQYIQFASASLRIMDSSSKKLLQLDRYGLYLYDTDGSTNKMILDRQGQKFYEGGEYVGLIGTNSLQGYSTKKSLSFNLDTNGSYMTWACKDNAGDSIYAMKLWYARPNTGSLQQGLALGSELYMNGRDIIVGSGVRLTKWSNTAGFKVYDKFTFSDGGSSICFELDTINSIMNIYRKIDMHGYNITNAGNVASDGRMKKLIYPSKINAIDRIKQISHRQFKWKKDDKQEEIGYIAQEMEKIDKNYVRHNYAEDEEGNITEDTYEMRVLPVLATATKAIQEQQEIIEGLEKKINILMEKLNIQQDLPPEEENFIEEPEVIFDGSIVNKDIEILEEEPKYRTLMKDLGNGEVEVFQELDKEREAN